LVQRYWTSVEQMKALRAWQAVTVEAAPPFQGRHRRHKTIARPSRRRQTETKLSVVLRALKFLDRRPPKYERRRATADEDAEGLCRIDCSNNDRRGNHSLGEPASAQQIFF
jgi:hypothetical protein